jgi:hypothetical protein
MSKTITLQCPNCGARLEITPDMEIFACGHCGTQQMVRRAGNTVSLKLIGEAVAGVKVNTDRMAAEMAVRRLRDDVEAIEKQRQELRQRYSTDKEAIYSQSRSFSLLVTIGGLLFMVVFWWIGRTDLGSIGLVIALGLCVIGVPIYWGKHAERETRTEKEEAELDLRCFPILVQLNQHAAELTKPQTLDAGSSHDTSLPTSASPYEWFFVWGDKRHGPVSLAQIKGRLASNLLGRHDRLWTAGLSNWVQIGKVEQFLR